MVYVCSTTMSSTFTLDKVLLNAKNLVTRLKDQEGTLDSLLSQTQDLGKKVESMKMVSIWPLLEVYALHVHVVMIVFVICSNYPS